MTNDPPKNPSKARAFIGYFLMFIFWGAIILGGLWFIIEWLDQSDADNLKRIHNVCQRLDIPQDKEDLCVEEFYREFFNDLNVYE